MKHLSLQWRITLLTALLIACACVCMNLLLYQMCIRDRFCFLLRGEAGSLYRPRSEVLRMLTVGEACGVCDAVGAPAGAVLLQPCLLYTSRCV